MSGPVSPANGPKRNRIGARLCAKLRRLVFDTAALRGQCHDAPFGLHLKEYEFRFNHRCDNLHRLLLNEFKINPFNKLEPTEKTQT